jgi:hypothetical protein
MDRPGGVVTIVGGPVIGKTCLAASWMNSALLSNRSMCLFWYRIDDADQDIATFFQLIGETAAGWAAAHPKLPAYSAEADLGGFTAAWVKALFRVTPRPAVAFIFDDVHRLVPDAPLLLVLGKLARALGGEWKNPGQTDAVSGKSLLSETREGGHGMGAQARGQKRLGRSRDDRSGQA